MKRIALPLATGIALAEWLMPTADSRWLLIATAIVLVATTWWHLAPSHNTQTQRFVTRLQNGLRIMLFAFVGMTLHSLSQPHSTIPIGKNVVVLQLDENPRTTARSRRSAAHVLQVQHGEVSHNEKMMLYLRPCKATDSLRAGDVVQVYGNVRDSIKSDRTFNYTSFLRHRGISHLIWADSTQWRRLSSSPTTLRHHSQRLQMRLAHRLEKADLTQQHRSIVAAMVLGKRDASLDISREQYQQAGIVHLLCVSGLHVGLIAMIVTWVLMPLGNSRPMRIVRYTLQLMAVWAFVIVSGMGNAALRAAVMMTVIIIGNLLHRGYDNFNSLAVAAVLTLLINPMALFDVGFQLSYSAMIGIFVLLPFLTHHQADFDSHNPSYTTTNQRSSATTNITIILKGICHNLWRIAALSLSAQAFNLPLVLYYFHQIPTYFLLANILIIPFSAIILLFAIAVLITLWTPIAWLLEQMLWVIDQLNLRIGALPYSTIHIENFSIPSVALCYLVLVAIVLVILRQKRTYPI